MKLPLFICSCLAGLLVGCGADREDTVAVPSQSEPIQTLDDAAAIRQVLADRNYIHNQTEDEANFLRNNFGENEKIARQAKSLKKLDISRCPEDFRNAFLEHIHALEALDRSLTDNPVAVSLVEEFRIVPPAVKEARQRVLETWQNVEKAAIEHGIAMHELN